MDSKPTQFHALTASLARRVFLRALFLLAAVSLVSFLRLLPSLDLQSLTPQSPLDCPNLSASSAPQNDAALTPGSYLFQSRILNTFWASFDAINCHKHFNFTSQFLQTLIRHRLVNRASHTLCIGRNSPLAVSAINRLGFSSVTAIQNNPFFSLNTKTLVSRLRFNDSSFDFVLSKDFDQVSLPALFVFEVERVLRPGGIAAFSSSREVNVSSMLRSSSVVHVGRFDELGFVVFRKRSESGNGAPGVCENVAVRKSRVEMMEPLVEGKGVFGYEKSVSYLPGVVDVSRKKRLVYIDIGVGESQNENVSNWFPPCYPIDQRDFSVYFVHYNASLLLSYVKQPRVTFVYHPGLAGNMPAEKGEVDPFLGEEEFDLLVWFKETVQNADFVVLKMNAGEVEMKFLNDVVESGAICFVDELFLGCSESDGTSESMVSKRRCMDIYTGLRRNGVYVHQLWDTKFLQGSQVSYV